MGLNVVALADTEIPPEPHPLLVGVGPLEGSNEEDEEPGRSKDSPQLPADNSSSAGNPAGAETSNTKEESRTIQKKPKRAISIDDI